MANPLSTMWNMTLDSAPDFDTLSDVDKYVGSAAIAYYLSLPTSLYKTKTNFMAFLQLLLQPFDDCAWTTVNMYKFFDIDSAVGPQLDMIGELLGQIRTVSFQPTDGTSPVLSDSNYAILLKATIIKNTWDGTIPSLYSAWSTLFPSGVIVIQDNQDMSMNIILSGNFTSTVHDLIINGYIVPRPAGVLVNYSIGTLPVFGYGIQSNYISGYNVGKWLLV